MWERQLQVPVVDILSYCFVLKHIYLSLERDTQSFLRAIESRWTIDYARCVFWFWKSSKAEFQVGPKGGSQIFQQWDKDQAGNLKKNDLMGVIYIPLTDAEDQLNDTN